MLLGGIICWWPQRRRRHVAAVIPLSEKESASSHVGAGKSGVGTLASPMSSFNRVEALASPPTLFAESTLTLSDDDGETTP